MLDCLAQNLLGKPLRVDIRGVKKADAGFHTEIDEPCGLRHIRRTPSAEKLISAAKSRSAEAKHRNLQTTFPELSEFHVRLDGPGQLQVATFLFAQNWRRLLL